MKSVSELSIHDVFNVENITDVFHQGLLVELVRSERQLEIDEYINHQQGLELSLAFLFRQGKFPNGIPEEFSEFRGKPGFGKKLKNYVKNHYGIVLPPKQISFSLLEPKSKFEVATVHLADLTDERWALIDICLQKQAPPQSKNELNAEHSGLGHGIFDETLQKIESTAKTAGVNELCLMAYLARHRRLFESRGYELMPATVVVPEMLNLANRVQMSFPMWKRIK
ncbi:hypothetical protein K2X05_06050 [bacterium]|nr:hypothetical protein [bacterium]